MDVIYTYFLPGSIAQITFLFLLIPYKIILNMHYSKYEFEYLNA